MKITLPEQGLVVLVGPSGSGKSSFARGHFLPTEVVSLDGCQGWISEDQAEESIPAQALEQFITPIGQALRNRSLVVADSTNLRSEERKVLRRLASEHHSLCSVLLFDTPLQVCQERQSERVDQQVPEEVLHRQHLLFRESCLRIATEKFHQVYRLRAEDLEGLEIERTRLDWDRRDLEGPFDLIGDLHGCADELRELLSNLGYVEGVHPEGRRLIFLGDITDRGPKNLECLETVHDLVTGHHALCVCGNHDAKLSRYLEGRKVKVGHGLEKTVIELQSLELEDRVRLKRFLDNLGDHYVLDEGRLVVAHGGIKEEYQGGVSNRVRSFCLYGDTTGEVDEFGLPIRLNWAADYRGQAFVVYGHTPVVEAEWLNRTINIDTGCVFGGRLTALRYPELELVSVTANQVYATPRKVGSKT